MYSLPMYSKELIRGTLSTLVLKVLQEKGRMYGYEIAQTVKEISSEKILVKEGSLYPLLHKLEAEGLVTVEPEQIGKRVRKYYSLTQSGSTETANRVQHLKEFMLTLKNFIGPVPGLDLSI